MKLAISLSKETPKPKPLTPEQKKAKAEKIKKIRSKLDKYKNDTIELEIKARQAKTPLEAEAIRKHIRAIVIKRNLLSIALRAALVVGIMAVGG